MPTYWPFAFGWPAGKVVETVALLPMRLLPMGVRVPLALLISLARESVFPAMRQLLRETLAGDCRKSPPPLPLPVFPLMVQRLKVQVPCGIAIPPVPTLTVARLPVRVHSSRRLVPLPWSQMAPALPAKFPLRVQR